MDDDLRQFVRDLRDAGVWHYGLPKTIVARTWDKFRTEIAKKLRKMGYRRDKNTFGVYPDDMKPIWHSSWNYELDKKNKCEGLVKPCLLCEEPNDSDANFCLRCGDRFPDYQQYDGMVVADRMDQGVDFDTLKRCQDGDINFGQLNEVDLAQAHDTKRRFDRSRKQPDQMVEMGFVE